MASLVHITALFLALTVIMNTLLGISTTDATLEGVFMLISPEFAKSKFMYWYLTFLI